MRSRIVTLTTLALCAFISLVFQGSSVRAQDRTLVVPWLLGGNAGIVPGKDFIGTIDQRPVELRVHNQHALRLEPSDGTPNLIGGAANNAVASGVSGATIGGGGSAQQPHLVSGDFATVSGGEGNHATTTWATVGGGIKNVAHGVYALVGGGAFNAVRGDGGSVGGGTNNVVDAAYATIAGGYANYAPGNHASIAGGSDNQAMEHAAIGGGNLNYAHAPFASIGGGQGNRATAMYATIGGGGPSDSESAGSGNRVTDSYGTVGGGSGNQAGDASDDTTDRSYATVSGGSGNVASGSFSVSGGGNINLAGALYSSVGGGAFNMATGESAVVGGGLRNHATSFYSVIPGGANNRAEGLGTTVSGGVSNVVNGGWATIAGGYENIGSANYVAMGGGINNSAQGHAATVGGGEGNAATAAYTTVAGGGRADAANMNTANRATDAYGTVGGGGDNQAGDASGAVTDKPFATVSGGRGNRAMSGWASIGGGYRNDAIATYTSIGGGFANVASGAGATVPGGQSNTSSGILSFAAGNRAKATHNGAFVWADGQPFNFTSRAVNQMSVRATGGVRLVSGIDGVSGQPTSGVILPAGGGSWSTLSDRNAKTQVTAVDSRAILQQLMSIPITQWSYRTQSSAIRHMGPMAQDFSAAFNIGEDAQYINAVDIDGVALASIQGLYHIVHEQNAENARLQQQLDERTQDLAALEQRLTRLERQGTVSSFGTTAAFGMLASMIATMLATGMLFACILRRRANTASCVSSVAEVRSSAGSSR